METEVIYAELRREGYIGSKAHTLRYLVWTENGAGSYSVQFNNSGHAYGASRDYHQPATPKMLADREAWLSAGGWDNDDNELPHVPELHRCGYVGDVAAQCDGSLLVEVITDDDEKCFAIAAMMAP